MNFPRFVHAEQISPTAPSRISKITSVANFRSDIVKRVPKGASIAIGVGSRGIANIARITKATVNFWKEQGAQPFIIPAMGSHGAATAEGQSDVLSLRHPRSHHGCAGSEFVGRCSAWHNARKH